MVPIVRTPEECFSGLPDFAYEPGYAVVEGLRLAHVDVGRGAPVLLIHGEPTWGYVWRQVIPPLVGAGLRVIAVDQVGFGRSDKPAHRDWYSYDRLTHSLTGHLEALGLADPVTLVVHDWGGPVGLRWAVEHPDRVERLVLLNTGLYAGRGGPPSEAWRRFRDFVARAEALPIGSLVQGGCLTRLPDEVVAAYEAPFHEPAAQSGALALPLLVPTRDEDAGAREMADVLARLGGFERPTLVLWGAEDPILPTRIGERFAAHIAGARSFETIHASHFLQEDAGADVGERVARFVRES